MQRVIHITRRLVKEKWGGKETMILEVSKELMKAGHIVEVDTSLIFSDQKKELIEGVPVIRYPRFYTYFGLSKESRERLDSIGGSFFCFSLFLKLLSMKDVKVFHLHTAGRLGGLVRTTARLRKIPYVVTLHGEVLTMSESQRKELMKPLKGLFDWGKPLGFLFGSRRVYEDADAIICVSRREAELMREKFPGKKVVYMSNGVNVQKFENGDGKAFRNKHNIASGEKVILCVSRIDPQKNQLLLVDVFKKLKEKGDKLKLVLMGSVTDEVYYRKLQSRIHELSLDDEILTLGNIGYDSPELVNAYAASNVFVLPSRHEPFGIVILEAWAAKRPVIASNVGGIPAVVEDEKTGLLFESGSREALEKAMQKVLDNREFAMSLAQNGHEEVKKYGWGQIRRKLMDLYDEVSK